MSCDCCGRSNQPDEPYDGWLREYFEPYYETICACCGQMLESEAHDLLGELAQRLYYAQKTNTLIDEYLRRKADEVRRKARGEANASES